MAIFIQRSSDKDGPVFELKDNEILIGRNSQCRIAINNSTVSSRHARVLKEGQYYKLEDTGSLNGTFLNGKMVRNAILKNGDRVRIGEIILIYYEDLMQRTARCLNNSMSRKRFRPV